MTGVSSLFLPVLESRFAIWGLYWQELHRYWKRGAYLIAADWFHRNISIQKA